MIKVYHFHQLMSHTWKIVTSDNLDGVAEDNILTITQSTSKKIPSPKYHDFKPDTDDQGSQLPPTHALTLTDFYGSRSRS